MKRKVYLDNNSSTQVDPAVLEVMLPYFSQCYGNPSNLHCFGRETREAVEQAREKVAKLIKAKTEEIIFTSSGTESNNFAIKGCLDASKAKDKHIITSSVEHSSINHSFDYIKDTNQARTTKLPVNQYGEVNPAELKKVITKDTILVSVMHCNNEVGTIEPIKELSAITHSIGAYFHTDAVATAGKIPIDVDDLGLDLLTITAHKIHGPKAVAALYIRNGTKIESLIHGGLHEHGLRAGTENVPGIVGFGKAAEIAVQDLKTGVPDKIRKLRDYLEEQIKARIPEIKINGHPTNRVCNIVNVSFAYIEGEALLMNLDLEGVAVSSVSACTVGKSEPSHVLKAMGVEDKFLNSPIRFSLDHSNTKEEIDYTIETLVNIAERLRKISPLWKPSK
jgi:cysteine desulfurase